VLSLLQQLNKDFGKTIVMVTHDPHCAAAASRLIHLDKGQVRRGRRDERRRRPSAVIS
jgi:putative ABC transport system ATP-binding protein